MNHQPVHIVGGGLAGLSLGIALREADIPVTLWDAGHYPRHRVCGEFICGIRSESLRRLHIDSHFRDAQRHRKIEFFLRHKSALETTIPRDAFGISRYTLDFRLAEDFRRRGGRLQSGKKVNPSGKAEPGWVWASGRQVRKSPWLGLKMHFSGLDEIEGLQLHLGHQGYVGISAIEGGRHNVCGLFRKRPGIRARKQELLFAYLEQTGLHALAQRLREAEPLPESALGVSSVLFDRTFAEPDRCFIGDHYSAIPPFTGNGMSIAMESAELALEPLTQWSRRERTWADTLDEIRGRMQRHTGKRLLTARALHPLIYHRPGQNLLALLARTRVLPFQRLFLLTH